jgi:hypothetical protein
MEQVLAAQGRWAHDAASGRFCVWPSPPHCRSSRPRCPGLSRRSCRLALARPDSDLGLGVSVGRVQLSPAEKAACWQRFRQAIGPLGMGVDLVVAGAAAAERLSGSRWHVFGEVAREGKVPCVAGLQGCMS